MALPILDGNQSATTLSTILSSGQHITAHTVVSLGTQAITDMRGAVSGSVVSISNLPSTQTIAGTVTIGGFSSVSVGSGALLIGGLRGGSVVGLPLDSGSGNVSVQLRQTATTINEPISQSNPLWVTQQGSVTIGSLPAISGTVTANVAGNLNNTIEYYDEGSAEYVVAVHIKDVGNNILGGGTPLAISGTVTANALGYDYPNSSMAQIPVHDYNEGFGAGYKAIPALIGNELGGFNSSNPLPISGTVTANVDSGSLITAFNDFGASYSQAIPVAIDQTGFGNVPISGTVTLGASTSQIGSVTASISNSVTIASFATSVTARLINPAGTAVTYAEVGTAGNPSIDVLSVQGVTSGTAIPISISSVTIGSLPAISGTVTANLAISSTVITSGSFTSLTSATLVPANPARKMATVYNLGAGQLFINAGVTATTLGGGFMVALSSGDFYECNYTTTTLSAIFATAGTASWVSH